MTLTLILDGCDLVRTEAYHVDCSPQLMEAHKNENILLMEKEKSENLLLEVEEQSTIRLYEMMVQPHETEMNTVAVYLLKPFLRAWDPPVVVYMYMH